MVNVLPSRERVLTRCAKCPKWRESRCRCGADVRGYSAAGGCGAVATYLGDLPAIDRTASRPSRSNSLKRATRANVNMSLPPLRLVTPLDYVEHRFEGALIGFGS